MVSLIMLLLRLQMVYWRISASSLLTTALMCLTPARSHGKNAGSAVQVSAKEMKTSPTSGVLAWTLREMQVLLLLRLARKVARQPPSRRRQQWIISPSPQNQVYIRKNPLHYVSSRFVFGFEFAEIFEIKKRLSDAASPRVVFCFSITIISANSNPKTERLET